MSEDIAEEELSALGRQADYAWSRYYGLLSTQVT